MGRLLGLDYGEKRVGVAVSDPLHVIATAHEVITARSAQEQIARIAALCDELNVEGIVIGWPLNMDGSAGAATERVDRLIQALTAVVDLPVIRWDERLTTRTAEHALIEAGTRRGKRKTLVDKVAAQVLLQHYLDSQPGP